MLLRSVRGVCSSSSRCVSYLRLEKNRIGVYREAVVSRRILKTIGYAIFGLLVQRINVLMLFQRVHIYSVWPGIFHGLRIFSAFYCSGLSSW